MNDACNSTAPVDAAHARGSFHLDQQSYEEMRCDELDPADDPAEEGRYISAGSHSRVSAPL